MIRFIFLALPRLAKTKSQKSLAQEVWRKLLDGKIVIRTHSLA